MPNKHHKLGCTGAQRPCQDCGYYPAHLAISETLHGNALSSDTLNHTRHPRGPFRNPTSASQLKTQGNSLNL